jgi:hypothetical protein
MLWFGVCVPLNCVTMIVSMGVNSIQQTESAIDIASKNSIANKVNITCAFLLLYSIFSNPLFLFLASKTIKP